MRVGTGLAFALVLACAHDEHRPEIVITTIATLGDTVGEGALAQIPGSIARDGRGRYFTAPPFGAQSELVAVYDSTGRFLGRIGRLGSGPGEYRQPNVVLAIPGDTIWIFDAGTRRLNVLDPDLAWLGSRPLPTLVPHAAPLADGGWLTNTPMASLDSTGGFLQRYDQDGDRVRVYEDPRLPCTPERCLWEGFFMYSADDRGGVWAVRLLGDLEISRYDSAGGLRRRMPLEAPWFPHRDIGRFPREMMTGIRTDASGRIWLTAMTGDARGIPDSVAPERPGDPAVYDGIVEVRDSTTGAVIATRRFDTETLLLPIARDLVASIGQQADGWARVEIWRMEVKE